MILLPEPSRWNFLVHFCLCLLMFCEASSNTHLLCCSTPLPSSQLISYPSISKSNFHQQSALEPDPVLIVLNRRILIDCSDSWIRPCTRTHCSFDCSCKSRISMWLWWFCFAMWTEILFENDIQSCSVSQNVKSNACWVKNSEL